MACRWHFSYIQRMSKAIFKIKVSIFSKIPEALQMQVECSELGLLRSFTLGGKDNLKIHMQLALKQWFGHTCEGDANWNSPGIPILTYLLVKAWSLKAHSADHTEEKQLRWWACILIKPLEREVWHYQHFQVGPAISDQEMYPTDIHAYRGGDICTLLCNCSVFHNNKALGKASVPINGTGL